MASKFNSEFNYRYQVVGETPWEKIKTLHGFLEGRKATRTLQEVGRLKDQAKLSKLKHLQNGGGGLEYEKNFMLLQNLHEYLVILTKKCMRLML